MMTKKQAELAAASEKREAMRGGVKPSSGSSVQTKLGALEDSVLDDAIEAARADTADFRGRGGNQR